VNKNMHLALNIAILIGITTLQYVAIMEVYFLKINYMIWVFDKRRKEVSKNG